MASIRQAFGSLGFSNVATAYISGNVVFETETQDASELEKIIESGLVHALGFKIDTFIRTDAELAAIAKFQPFPTPAIDNADEFNVIFLASAPDEETRQKILALKTDIVDFAIHGREIYWLRHKKPGTAFFSTVPLGRVLEGPFTIRTFNVVNKIALKYFSKVI